MKTSLQSHTSALGYEHHDHDLRALSKTDLSRTRTSIDGSDVWL